MKGKLDLDPALVADDPEDPPPPVPVCTMTVRRGVPIFWTAAR